MSHLLPLGISGEFDSHFKGSDLLPLEQIHPDRVGSEPAPVQVGRAINGQLQQKVFGIPGGMKDMKTIAQHLGHQQAGTVLGNINDSSGKRAGEAPAALSVHCMNQEWEIIDDSAGSALVHVHGQLLEYDAIALVASLNP